MRCPRLDSRYCHHPPTEQTHRLVDALLVWGDEKAIRARIDEHWQAAADHVCIQAIGETALPDERLLGLLAPRP